MSKPSDFNWEDPLDLESWLTEEERMIRDSAQIGRASCRERVLMPV